GSFISNVEALAFGAADELYAIRWPSSSPNLYRVNLENGEATLIGSTGVADLIGMSFDPVSGTLYASRGSGTDEIYTVNASTGAATLVGTTGLSSSIPDIAFDQAGALYGVTSFEGPAPWSLITINPTTAAGAVVGPLGIANVSGLTFVPPRQSGGQIAVHPSHAEFGNV
ncbi:hypothetical protein L6R21_28325, partial [bacterium]|nr:hypothetical protein [bacterium]